MKEYSDIILDLPFKGGNVIAVTGVDVVVEKIPESSRHSSSLLNYISKVCPDKTFIRKLFVNIGPGNFSSLRVVIISALGLVKGLNISNNDLQGFSVLDVIASNYPKSEKFSIHVSDNRGGFLGSSYVRNEKLEIAEPMFRLSAYDAEEKLEPIKVIEDFKNLEPQKIIKYIYSSDFCQRDIMDPLYYQKSYFEK